MAKTLINFLVEEDDLRRFDAIVEMLGRTRTSILKEMMNDFVTEQSIVIEQKKRKLQEVDRILAEYKSIQENVNNNQQS